ncbi:motility associated factor glycosyltransferase family protein [Campylobacter sp. MIT 19-121]|uniref:motility associated factor glycosyltransferase family protein n=1 Tax=Campylobacter sp. MIT 19-121 TaxID=2703906 RepID=UPI00138A512E|nr:motility associated factor glycosyltransferase family protein [Campylobacter sp. MIT 19-121]NDJ26745.1 motility associated factor glycosyltransferase family protein [Campylobacter sp. MIT 19-121]
MQQTTLFEKNIDALKGTSYKELKDELLKIKAVYKFKYEFDPKDTLNTNIIDLQTQRKMYQAPLRELEESLEPFKDEFKRYPVLFFYGMGNGILYKVLAQNETHRRIVIFEKELELIYMAFNLIDFSETLITGQIIIIHTKDYDSNKATMIFSLPTIVLFLKLYNLRIHCTYYENQSEEITRINDINSQAIRSVTLKHGNDPADALMGIEHFTLHLPYMLTHPTFKELLKKRKNKGKNAIFVATGPSLSKQFDLLKKYKDNAVIFCADSSYALLYKQGIKPDYVLSLERGERTAELFNNDFGEFDKGIVFILFALTHPNTIKYLERNKRAYMLTQRNLAYSSYLDLKDFGYLGGGMSVMNMAHELGIMLGYKNLFFIGQDLAYSKEGKSHPDDYMFADLGAGGRKRDDLKIKAYGGKGEVKTSEVWMLFKGFFENLIASQAKDVKFYNCTEGGARIEGSIEIPFKEACEQFLSKEVKKHLPKLQKPSRKESNEYMLKAYEKIKKGMRISQRFIKKSKKIQKQLQGLTRGVQTSTLDDINKSIDEIKKALDSKKTLYFKELLGPSLFHQELQSAPLYVQNFNNESERQNKLMAWIFSHEAWLEEIIDFLSIMEEKMKADIVPLREALEKRKLL